MKADTKVTVTLTVTGPEATDIRAAIKFALEAIVAPARVGAPGGQQVKDTGHGQVLSELHDHLAGLRA